MFQQIQQGSEMVHLGAQLRNLGWTKGVFFPFRINHVDGMEEVYLF